MEKKRTRVHNAELTRSSFSIFFLWLQAAQIYPHCCFGLQRYEFSHGNE